MATYEELSKRELFTMLQALQADPRLQTTSPESERLIHDLQVHQIELEMQNRELREAQQAIEESHRRYADLYDFAPVVYFTLDRETSIVEANLAAVALLGLDRASLVGRRLTSFVSASDRKLLLTHVHACFEGRGRASVEITLTVRGLADIVAQAVCTAVEDAAGSVNGVKMTLMDITALRRSKEKLTLLARASETLASSFDSMANLAAVVKLIVPQFADVCFADLEQEGQLRRVGVALADPKKAKVVEATRNSLLRVDGKSPQAEVFRTAEPIFLPECKASMLTRSASGGLEYETIIKSCGPRSLMFVPILAQGSALGVLTFVQAESGRAYSAADMAVARDLGSRAAMAIENARLYAEAQAAIRARQDILAIVSHDLRSPLMTVMLNAELLSRALPATDDQNVKRKLVSIIRSVKQMTGMVDDLLDTSSVEAGKLSIERGEHDLNGVLTEAFETFLPRAQEKGIELRTELLRGTVNVLCDRDRTLQVLTNLLSNAIKFTPGGGAITVTATLQNRYVRVAVRDTGPGIPASMVNRVFDRYWQKEETASKGRGLGLYIARGIMAAQRGTLSVESQEGAGATFFFTLPLAATTPALAAKTNSTPTAVAMVVDDDRNVREALALALASRGYSVVRAADGQAAMGYLRSEQPHPGLILLDLEMPVMDGRRVLQELKADPSLSDIPVYVVSGHRIGPEEAPKLGATGYFDKSVAMDDMFRAIESGRDQSPASA